MIDDDTWARRERVWTDALAEEILARKAAEAALHAFTDKQYALIHPQVQMLGKQVEDAHKALDSLSIPRGRDIGGDAMASMDLSERILLLASMRIEWKV